MTFHIRNAVQLTFLSIALVAVTACGGGGSTPPPPPPAMYSISGTVSGLDAGQSVVLQLNGSNGRTVSTNGAFTFAFKIANGGAYAVTAVGGPAEKTCTVNGGAGTASANVTSVAVTCVAFSIGGVVSGLIGQGFELALGEWKSTYQGAHFFALETLAINKNGHFAFAAPSPSRVAYYIEVRLQPHAPVQRCVVRNGDDRVIAVAITDVEVVCGEFSYVTNAAGNTISAFSIDATTGAIASVGPPVTTGVSPLAIAGTSDKKYVYVVNSGSNDVSGFAVDLGTGALTAVHGSPFAAGTNPRALALYEDSYLYVANSGSDDISVYQIDHSNGALSPLAPCATCSRSTGGGPTAIAIAPHIILPGPNLVTANTSGANISAFEFYGYGDLVPASGSPFLSGGNISTLAFGAGGNFLYAADASGATAVIVGYNTLPTSSTDVLTRLSGFPLALPSCTFIVADQTGTYLYATTGTDLLGYSIDATTGALTALAGFPIAVGAEVRSVSIDPTNQFLYVANGGAGTVTSYTLNAATGALTLMPGSPFAVGTSADYIATF